MKEEHYIAVAGRSFFFFFCEISCCGKKEDSKPSSESPLWKHKRERIPGVEEMCLEGINLRCVRGAEVSVIGIPLLCGAGRELPLNIKHCGDEAAMVFVANLRVMEIILIHGTIKWTTKSAKKTRRIKIKIIY